MAGEDRKREKHETRRRIGEAAASAARTAVRAGAEAYDRLRDLPRLARMEADLCTAENAESAEAIVARLERALRAERNRARSGHWTYDLNRHIALAQAYRAEAGRLAALRAVRR